MKIPDHLKNNWNGVLYLIGILVLILLFAQLKFSDNKTAQNNAAEEEPIAGIPVPADTTTPPAHLLHEKMITSELWTKLATLTYKKEIIDNEQWTIPVFAPEVKAMEGETITLKGYLIPLEKGLQHQLFMLSVLPIDQCYFCGKTQGVPEMVEVNMNKSIAYTKEAITIKGILQLNERDEEHFAMMLMGAEIVDQ
ncbi:hypothetical protein C3K47_15150 [Solitalea longa]|uniref:DUF3299 domain-containing protein n=1 Tax=Solitalea longa TaxID=2079460 RepID=A0A2S4ZZF8_9SPHI|nr:hypothetical protein [Solitalea longa]POY35397.1 hypothetical protein C3K47_15150 [Solitalea longa]